ncbi:hypothetical protein A3B35_00235 [Candidatus Kaiserbacteria bacterium RIFCSPLOWO2_01_FULL_54_24]|uniref:Transposase IS200-like domain-containing protein n=1 Tax=Candidatus Kaiserbacteria bacterium RIFCSPLOWO2_01_FULL_54_24 TaxID=1798515 RepID=A0A1F6ETA7_9BACT|nr:MAG: hypothetical protein A3B35_00235 [Candidatus Kaiserbacteria bacterium RIFCSPLOWO2_01_FULL_54_24]
MPRPPRVDVGDQLYHVINRANGRARIFYKDEDYRHFESLLRHAAEQFSMRILAYVLMPNHWHLVLYPRQDGDLSKFMQWLTLTHTQQYHVRTRTIGYGHIYQGRYKSFIIEKDSYLLAVIKYVERNSVRARLAKTVEQWRWGSGYRRLKGTPKEQKLLAKAPVDFPNNYRIWVNQPDRMADVSSLRNSVNKNVPFGSLGWTSRTVKQFGLEATLRNPGRPKST